VSPARATDAELERAPDAAGLTEIEETPTTRDDVVPQACGVAFPAGTVHAAAALPGSAG
jgi:hypothetical protein